MVTRFFTSVAQSVCQRRGKERGGAGGENASVSEVPRGLHLWSRPFSVLILQFLFAHVDASACSFYSGTDTIIKLKNQYISFFYYGVVYLSVAEGRKKG